MNLIIHLNRINYVNAIKEGVLIFLTYENAKAGEVVYVRQQAKIMNLASGKIKNKK